MSTGYVLFIGERRSPTAKRMRVRWEDGRLAAKQLFDAFDRVGFERDRAMFCNFSDRGAKTMILKADGSWPIVAMGRAAQYKLRDWGVKDFVPMVHPAARGRIRGKRRYAAEVRRALRKAQAL